MNPASAASRRGCLALLVQETLCAHVVAGSRAHGDDTAVPVLAKQWTRKGPTVDPCCTMIARS
jgi:hypothetical protein